MASETVEVVVVAAVGLVDDHDDVATIGEQRVVEARLPLLAGQPELLQGCEVDATRHAVCEFLAQLLARRHIDRALRQQLRAVERLKELAVELSAVGDHHERRVLQFLTAATFDAATALESGLITHAVPAHLLDHAVAEVVSELTACERQGLEATKRLLTADTLMYLDDRVEGMVELSAGLFASAVARAHLAQFGR